MLVQGLNAQCDAGKYDDFSLNSDFKFEFPIKFYLIFLPQQPFKAIVLPTGTLQAHYRHITGKLQACY
jgi:hypothetical protein